MEIKFDSMEATLLLDSLVKKRNDNLESIATLEVMNLNRKKYISTRELVDVMYENSITDAFMDRYFSQGFLFMPTGVTELHLKRCDNSGISECTCLVTNTKPEVTIQ